MSDAEIHAQKVKVASQRHLTSTARIGLVRQIGKRFVANAAALRTNKPRAKHGEGFFSMADIFVPHSPPPTILYVLPRQTSSLYRPSVCVCVYVSDVSHSSSQVFRRAHGMYGMIRSSPVQYSIVQRITPQRGGRSTEFVRNCPNLCITFSRTYCSKTWRFLRYIDLEKSLSCRNQLCLDSCVCPW